MNEEAALDPRILLQQLAKLREENVSLREKLETHDHSKLLTDVVLAETKTFLQSSKTLPSQPCPQEVHSMAVALEEICEKNNELQRTLDQLRGTVDQMREAHDELTTRCEALVAENNTLKLAQSSEQAELAHQLSESRRLEEDLRAQISALSVATARASSSFQDGLQKLRLRFCITSDDERFEELQVAISALKRDIEEANARHQLQAQRNDAMSTNEVAAAEDRASALQFAFDELKAKFMTTASDASELKSETIRLRKRLQEKEEEERSLELPHYQELKRRRLEIDNAVSLDENSLKRELIVFWYDGHERIEALESELATLRTHHAELSEREREINELKQFRSSNVHSVTALTSEVERLRNEVTRLRSTNIGLQAENSVLSKHLANMLGTHMSEEELGRVADALRFAATQTANSSQQTAVDPAEIERGLRASQQLRYDIAQLTTRKEELHKLISLRETRLQCGNSVDNMMVVVPALGQTNVDQSFFVPENCFAVGTGAVHEEILAHRQELFEIVKVLTCGYASMLTKRECQCADLQARLSEAYVLAQGTCDIACEIASTLTQQLDVVEKLTNDRHVLQKHLLKMDVALNNHTSTDFDVTRVMSILQEQLAQVKEAMELDSVKHSASEAKYVLALVKELQTKESSFETAREQHEESMKKHAELLSTAIQNAQTTWTHGLEQELIRLRDDKVRTERLLLADGGVVSVMSGILNKPQGSNVQAQTEVKHGSESRLYQTASKLNELLSRMTN